jgi:hypothetical protein
MVELDEVRMRNGSVSSRLRQLADWIDANEVTNGEVTCLSVDGWGDMNAQLHQTSVIRICGPNGVTLSMKDDAVHGSGTKDGVRVVFCIQS